MRIVFEANQNGIAIKARIPISESEESFKIFQDFQIESDSISIY